MIVDIAVPFRVPMTFHYETGLDLEAKVRIGSIVEIPFRNQPTHGFVVGFSDKSNVPIAKLRTISGVIGEDTYFDEGMLSFLKWIAEYYCHPLGEVISTAIPRHAWERTKRPAQKRTPSALQSLAGTPPEHLTEEQARAVDQILNEGKKRPFLLHGVTGSGKTEVYIRVLQKIITDGMSAIVLVPEISLTPLLTSRFSTRFGDSIAIWHSNLTPRERREEWDRVRRGEAKIVIGARSAVFAPVTQLGCIVVDEEHEPSFKQEDELRYHARDVAIVRASQSGAQVVLGSATPSVESYYHATTGKYGYAKLSHRIEHRPMPTLSLVDLKSESERISEVPWLGSTLESAIRETLEQKNQVVLYLNRLGFAHMLYCADCGHSWRCINCDVGLTFYRNPRLLKCHYCGLRRNIPDSCDHCGGTRIDTVGFGTEQVEKTLRDRFPQARIGRMDRSVITTKKGLEALLQQIANGELDIIVGTQMIAKGHDFAGITLVGVLIADSSLNIPDFRAYERTYQLLTQVSGRAGRAKDPGRVIIQTFQPDHEIMRLLGKCAEDFYTQELDSRLRHRFPPFSRLALVRFQHKNATRTSLFAKSCADELLRQLSNQKLHCSLLGPSEAPIARLRNYYRWQLLLKSSSVNDLKKAIGTIRDYALVQKSPVQVYIDVDPITSL